MPYLYSPRRYAASVRTIRELAAAQRRELSEDFEWAVFLFTNVGPDGDRAREGAARMMGGNYRQDFREMVDNVAAAGTVAEVTDKLVAFVEAGVRHVVFMPATRDGDADEIVHRLVGEVVPAVRERVGATDVQPRAIRRRCRRGSWSRGSAVSMNSTHRLAGLLPRPAVVLTPQVEERRPPGPARHETGSRRRAFTFARKGR